MYGKYAKSVTGRAMKRFPQLSSFHAKAQVLEIHT
jgi:hypothetical protein